MMDFLGNIFGVVIKFFCDICGNQYWLGIFVFTVVINALLLPLNIKQQKSTASQARLRNKMARIKEKYGDDRAKYQEEMSKIYAESGSSPLGGCLLLFIRLPIFFAIYSAIQRPLTTFYGASKELIADAQKLIDAGVIKGGNPNLPEHTMLNENNIETLKARLPEFAKLTEGNELNFDFLGLNLFDTPNLGNLTNLIWIIPLLSFATSMLMSVYTTMNNKKTNPDAAGAGMGCMLFGMPIFSLILTFNFPGAVGWYWTCSNIVSTIISIAMTKLYSPGKLIAEAEAKEARARRAYEQNIINPQPKTEKKSLFKK